MKFIICAPSYDENSGGSIVLHRLCDIINSHGLGRAFIMPLRPSYFRTIGISKLYYYCQWLLKDRRKYQTKPGWNTPISHKKEISEDDVIIYPEVVLGNPLGGKNIVRWLLHQPGFHTGKIKFGEGEIFFKFNSAIDDYYLEKSTLAVNEMKVVYYPLDMYKNSSDNARTIECCHMIRKGGYKDKVHPTDSVCVDGLSHKQTADIFKSAKKFICYDDYTAYSLFAVLSGCESYVVPGKGVSLHDWYPNIQDRYGIAYGFDIEQQEWAMKTKDKVEQHIIKEHELSLERVNKCIAELKTFFFKEKS